MSSKGIQLGGSLQLQHIVCNRSTQSNVCSLEKGLGQCFTSHLCTTQVAAWSRARWDSRVPSMSTFHELLMAALHTAQWLPSNRLDSVSCN